MGGQLKRPRNESVASGRRQAHVWFAWVAHGWPRSPQESNWLDTSAAELELIQLASLLAKGIDYLNNDLIG